MERRYQYKVDDPIPLTPEAFEAKPETAVYWLTHAGLLINCRGTIILVDPLLEYTPGDPPYNEINEELMTLPPITVKDIPKVDAVFYTHADNDHLGGKTLKAIAEKFPEATFHGTLYTCYGKPLPYANSMDDYDIPKERCIAHKVGDSFFFGDIRVTVTIADHSWHIEPVEAQKQNYDPKSYAWGDCCGFRFETPDGIIWAPGDTMLLSEHLRQKDVDLSFFDPSPDKWHFDHNGIMRLFNGLRKTEFILFHCATVYAPDFPNCAGDPNDYDGELIGPERLHKLAPGEKYVLKRKASLE